MRTQRIKVTNVMCLPSFEMDTQGASIVVTGANNSGKTTLSKRIFELIKGKNPDKIVRHEQTSASAILELTNGDIFELHYLAGGGSKITYTTADGTKYDKAKDLKVIRQIAEKYFGQLPDIDKFLSETQPKKRIQMLSDWTGLDFSNVDSAYKDAYDNRTEQKRLLDILVKKDIKLPLVKISKPEIEPLQAKIQAERDRLNDLYKTNKANNDKIIAEFEAYKREELKKWNETNDFERAVIDKFNTEQIKKQANLNIYQNEFDVLSKILYFPDCIDFVKANNRIDSLPQPEPTKYFIATPMPEFTQPVLNDPMPDSTHLNELTDLLAKEQTKQNEYANYMAAVQKYTEWQNEIVTQSNIVADCEKEVEKWNLEKIKLIKKANLPAEFSIEYNEIYYKGLPISREQLSSSAIYIAALKLAILTIGEVRTLHFDASYLDKNSLSEIIEWANKNDLQLFIERPDYEAGELRYEIIES